MEIAEIKQQLTIAQVLAHYALQPDKNNMLHCPFHDDKTPSMQVYPETSTVFCFSSNCKLHGKGIDVIDFILHHEDISKREAIVKAKELAGYQESQQPFEKLFKVFQSNLKKNEKALHYLKERNIQHVEAGFNANTWENLKQCIIFPLKNKQNKIVSLYGRSVFNNTESRHFYTRNRKGLYPGWPQPETKQLILTEAIIDAATLRTDCTVLSCYGTNGFTAEHEQAIKELNQLEEIIIFFDGDQAGREAAKRITEKLHQLKPEIKISSVNTPEGEDINSLSQSHEEEIFFHLLQSRSIIFSPEGVPQTTENKITSTPASTYKLEIFPHRFLYRTATANYHIKGGLQNSFETLRVSLDIEHPQNGRKSRSKVDLYEDKQVEKLAREASDKLGLRADMVQLDLETLTSLLEAHREKTANKEEKPAATLQVPLHVQQKCIEFLTKPNLIKRLNEMIGQAGVVGEETNRIFLFGIASSYKMPETLHALIQGSSGSGKTHLLAKVSNFIPKEGKKSFTRVTEGSLYNYGLYDLSHQLICIEDLDGMKEEAQLAFRELQSKGVIISSTSSKDDNGNVNAYERIVYGPIASMACTTKGEIYEDNMSRCFLIAVDESHEQTIKIIQYQNKKSAGQIDEKREAQITEFLQHCLRILKPYQVINPYADKVNLPQEAHKIRRLNGLYQAFVKQITILHQYQRKQDAQGRLISQKEDLQAAAEIMFESIVLKVDELDGSLRQFYERLKTYVKTKACPATGGSNGHHESYEFSQREIRHALHISKSQLHRYMQDLLTLEYIRQAGGHINRGFNYKVLYWDNIAAIRAKVKRHLQGQLDQLELITA